MKRNDALTKTKKVCLTNNEHKESTMTKIKLLFVNLLAILGLVSVFAVGCRDDNEPAEQPASECSIAIEERAFTLEIYDTATLTVTSENLTEDIQFVSSNTEVAKVDALGTVTALKAGSATITASANGISANSNLTVVDSGYHPSLELSAHNVIVSEPMVVGAKIKFNNKYMTEGVAITWTVKSGTSITVSKIENSLNATLSLAAGANGEPTTIEVKATFNGEEMTETITAIPASANLDLSLDAPIVNKHYALEYDVIDGDSQLTTIDMAEMLSVSAGGQPVADYTVHYSSIDDNVAIVSNDGVITAQGIGTTTVYAEVDGFEVGLDVTFNYVNADMTAQTLSLELFDKNSYYADGTIKFNSGYTFVHNFGGLTGSISKVLVGDQLVFDGEVDLVESGNTTVELNLSNVNPYAHTITFSVGFASYTYTAKLYTMIMTTTADVQHWLDVAMGLKSNYGGKLDGYYILGKDITADAYWDYDAKSAEKDGFLYSDYSTGFVGTFDGNGHFIQKMNMIKNDKTRIGFIPVLAKEGVIKNVAFVDSRFTLKANLEQDGFLCNSIGGTVQDVYFDVELFAAGGTSYNYSSILARNYDSASTVQRVIIEVEVTGVTIGSWGATYESFAFFRDSSYVGRNNDIYIISDTGTHFAGSIDDNAAKAADRCVKFATIAEMKAAAATYGYSEHFVSPIWTMVDNMPQFASTVS